MQLLTLLALASAASAYIIEGRQTPNGSCASSLHVIAIGGSNSDDEYSLGLLSTLAGNITAQIPGSDFSSLPYNKVEPEPQMLTPGVIPAAITLLGQYVSDYHSACPDSKIAIIGYSSGAVISSVALCTEFTVPQSLATNTIIANVEYGAQTFVPGLSEDLGTCTSGSGTQPLTNPAGCGDYIPLTQSYCDLNDPQCCDGPQSDYEIHFVYPSEYDMQATDFVVSQYNKLGGGSASSPSSSTSRSSTLASSSTSRPVIVASSSSKPRGFPTATAYSNTTTVVSSSATSPVAISTFSATPAVSATASSSPSSFAGAGTSVKFADFNGLALLNAACIGAMMFLGALLL